MSAILFTTEQATFELSSSVSHWGMWLLIEHRWNGWYSIIWSDAKPKIFVEILITYGMKCNCNFFAWMATYFLQILGIMHSFSTTHFSEFKTEVSLVHRPIIEPVTCNLLTSSLRHVSNASFTFLFIFL